jgi:hypothetical protein
MAITRVTLITGALVAGVLLVQGFILGLFGDVYGYVGYGGSLGWFPLNASLFVTLLTSLLHYAAFGAGVFVSIRYLAPLVAGDSWRRVIVRGVIATVCGAIAALAFEAIVSLIAAITIGAYPFGYSLDAGFDADRVQFGIQHMLGGALTPLVGWLPLTVLACVFLKLWLSAHPALVEARDRVSASATP